jgi:hypothetical protein
MVIIRAPHRVSIEIMTTAVSENFIAETCSIGNVDVEAYSPYWEL